MKPISGLTHSTLSWDTSPSTDTKWKRIPSEVPKVKLWAYQGFTIGYSRRCKNKTGRWFVKTSQGTVRFHTRCAALTYLEIAHGVSN